MLPLEAALVVADELEALEEEQAERIIEAVAIDPIVRAALDLKQTLPREIRLVDLTTSFSFH